MTLACVLVISSLLVDPARPNPTPYSWVKHASMTGDHEFDSFAVEAVGLVRRADWDGVAKLCRRNVSFEVYEARKTDEEGSSMLFDDTKSDDDNRLLDFTLRSLVVEPAKPMSLFARSQFSFFAALVEGSVQSPQSVPHWGLAAPKDVHKTASGPAIWGPYASNASWRIEVDRNSGPWMIDKFVVEYR